ncbi:MAG: molybdenum cofactor biosynthesis protein MoaA [Gammaproteobacteria bacterium (ex Lamellibrachia satsuma)]|nr:MAG: GTP 3',8-cyclase MoaA [Gammaproteobacteria bacterium (ex Lamellibrachia satsuma)]RRS35933.1 MAG: molybdenum cofactor biosynthesis protein MoaA [Gammaproteobacteria bacterium (ex Lamellibrachia satsuma)]RRS36525.1 MAG: molybdenum cofactor biosynthesis protein MoaA [Gammaproteobacteria bacterium (ex Lamellibrachia satsuma)]
MLIDPFGRNIEYLRLSVTDRCDFRCFYCIPKGYKDFSQPDSWLTLDEVERLVRVFSEMGISKVRLTGGEPLVRKELPEMVRRIGALPQIEDLSLSTNASQLAKHAASLKQSGVSRINVSLDSLNPDSFREITQGDLGNVLDGLMAAKEVGLNPIKINMVVMKGINDHEIGEMVDFCLEHDFTLRFIETMPVGETGKSATDRFISLKEIKADLEERFQLEPAVMRGAGPASYVRVKETNLRIGFITPMSQHFCESCNRVRISVEGTLYLCLGKHDNAELRPLMRQGISDEGLKEVILEAIARKPARHEFNENPGEVVRVMSLTGG